MLSDLRRTVMKKYNLIALVIFCLVASALLAGAAGTGGTKVDFPKTTIDIGIVVSNVEKAAQFYKNVIGFTELSGFDVSKEMGRDAGLSNYQAFSVRVLVLADKPNATRIKIMEFPEAPGKKIDNRFIHSSLGFSYLTISVSDMTATLERAKKAGVAPVKKPYQLGAGNYYLSLLGPKK